MWVPCFGTHRITLSAVDSLEQERTWEKIIHVIELQEVDILLGMLGLADAKIELYPATKKWRFDFGSAQISQIIDR